MAKKAPPNLTVIGTEQPEPRPNPLSPPPTLGEAGRELWSRIHSDYVIEDAGGLAMLAQICAATDRVAEYAATIARDGPTVRTANGVKDHPLLRHEIACRSFIVRSLHRLNLDVIAPRTEPGRPSGGGDYRGDR